MIKSFRHKELQKLFESGTSRKIGDRYRIRALRRLDVLNQAEGLGELRIPGFDFHKLEGKPVRYSIHVNGNYCITFEWNRGDAWEVDFEDYH